MEWRAKILLFSICLGNYHGFLLPQPVLAWVFLGEPITTSQLAGTVLVAVAAVILGRRKSVPVVQVSLPVEDEAGPDRAPDGTIR